MGGDTGSASSLVSVPAPALTEVAYCDVKMEIEPISQSCWGDEVSDMRKVFEEYLAHAQC